MRSHRGEWGAVVLAPRGVGGGCDSGLCSKANSPDLISDQGKRENTKSKPPNAVSKVQKSAASAGISSVVLSPTHRGPLSNKQHRTPGNGTRGRFHTWKLSQFMDHAASVNTSTHATMKAATDWAAVTASSWGHDRPGQQACQSKPGGCVQVPGGPPAHGASLRL